MRRSKAVIACAAAVLVAVWGWRASRGPDAFTVDVLDVGQGDAILVHDGRSEALIDGGPDRLVLAALGATMPLGDRTIETVLLSHPDHDHIGGLFDVLDRYEVRRLVLADAWRHHRAAQRLAEAATAKGTEVVYVTTGDVVRLTDEVRFDVLWPDHGDFTSRVNNHSIVAALDGPTPGIEMLLTGDIEAPAEAALVARGFPSVTVLKAPHHGSRSSSTTAFLDMAAPKYAAVSVGEGNPYGHPSAGVLLRYATAGVTTWRTDELGTVRLAFGEDGEPTAFVRAWWGWRSISADRP